MMIKTLTPLFSLFLLMTSYRGYPFQLAYEPFLQEETVDYWTIPNQKRNLLVMGYCRRKLPIKSYFVITRYVYDNPYQYRKQKLPKDLSGRNLRGFDFTGCKFTSTNLTDTNLKDIILTNTICDYRKAFRENFKEQQCQDGHLAKRAVYRDLKYMSDFYSQVKNDADKAKILQVASGFSLLPFYKGRAFCIKWQYWSFQLLALKNKLGRVGGKKLTCSLEEYFKIDIREYCWSTQYRIERFNLCSEKPHANFDLYIKRFYSGIFRYACQAKDNHGTTWYKKYIESSIIGLKKAYPNIKEPKLQKKVCQVADMLSRSYRFGKSLFLAHYLACQNRLIRLREATNLELDYYPQLRYSIAAEYVWV